MLFASGLDNQGNICDNTLDVKDHDTSVIFFNQRACPYKYLVTQTLIVDNSTG